MLISKCNAAVQGSKPALYGRRFFKKSMLTLLGLFLALAAMAEGRAKYVFYFIGDGMGVNQVNAAITYRAALEGRIGTAPLCFTQFPYATLVTTFSATNGVTDSAAAGTALATGKKTKNGALGMLADQTTSVGSVATWAQKAGAAVGVSTSVSVDHATPAAFYAHQGGRGSYYAIGQDLVAANFDFYAGSDFLSPTNGADAAAPSLYDLCKKSGYTICRGYKDYLKQAKKAKKMVLFQTEEASAKQRNSLPYALDRSEADMTLAEVTRAGIHFLSKQKKEGFFLMVEGGKIDWACHSNDAATVIHEVIDMDEAVKVAYEFYLQHPDETLIVVTADHETGGIVLGRGPYELHTDLLRFQRMSTEAYGAHVKALHEELGERLDWQRMRTDLQANWGFGEGVTLSEKQWGRLEKAFQDMKGGQAEGKQTLYAKVDVLADAARAILAECALIGWQSGGHSNGFVPVYAIGAGAEAFHGQMDNTAIPVTIARAAGW